MIDEEIYLHVWKCYTAQSIHLESIFKRLRNWAHLHSSCSLFNFIPSLCSFSVTTATLWKTCWPGFIHHGILSRVLGKNWVIHHHLFKLRFCSLGFRAGIPVALVTVSPHCLKPLKRIPHCFRTWAAFLHCTSFLCLYFVYGPCIPCLITIAFMSRVWKKHIQRL